MSVIESAIKNLAIGLVGNKISKKIYSKIDKKIIDKGKEVLKENPLRMLGGISEIMMKVNQKGGAKNMNIEAIYDLAKEYGLNKQTVYQAIKKLGLSTDVINTDIEEKEMLPIKKEKIKRYIDVNTQTIE